MNANKRTRLSIAVSSVLAGAVLFTTPAVGQVLEEVKVTAQFRESTVQDTALSVTAFDEDYINKLRFQKSDDIARQAPGVQILEQYGQTAPSIVIRGITNPDFGPATGTPVSIYSDGVVLNNPTVHGFAMFDIERVEILRGPQGTLYGRNSTSGSVNFLSARPTDELSGFGQLLLADDGEFQFIGAASGALTDDLNGRVAINRRNIDGWVTNDFDLRTGAKREESLVRGVLEYTGEDVNVFFKVQYADYNGDPGNFFNTLPTNAFTQPNPGFRGDFSRINLNLFGRKEDVIAVDLALQVDWNLGNMVLTSVTGFGSHTRDYIADFDFSDLTLAHEWLPHEQDQWSQEFRLASNTDGPLSWILGLYYLNDSVDTEFLFDFSGAFNPNPDDFGIPTSLGGGFGSIYGQDIESTAVFAQIDYDISENWSAGFGLRYTSDEHDVTWRGANCYFFNRQDDFSFVQGFKEATTDCGGLPIQDISDDDSWDATTGTFSLKYRPTDQTLVYGNVGVGFKSGQFHLNTSDPSAVTSVEPEDLTSYDVGVKWESEDRSVVVNAAAYFYDYENLHQFQIVEVPGSQILVNTLSNVPEAEVYGAELEMMFAPLPDMLINLGFSWNETEYTDFTTLDGQSFNGNSFPNAPEFSFNGLVLYDFPLANGWTLTPQLDWSWLDTQFQDFNNTESVDFQGENVSLVISEDWDVNLRLTLANESGITITAFVEDIGEDQGDIIDYIPGLISVVGATSTKVTRPETFGLLLRYDF